MNALTIVVLLAIVVWWYKPLRVYLVQRTNRTVKVLLIVFPLLYAGRLAWRFYTGEQDDLDVVTITVFALLIAWAFLVWLTSFLERRRPTKVQAPDLATLAKLPGMPRIPGPAQQVMQSPEARQAVQAAAAAAANADWGNVAEGLGRSSGRFFARLKKGMAEGNSGAAGAPPAAPAPAADAPAAPPAAPAAPAPAPAAPKPRA
ncbi:MAG TPA: hypothetical protein VH257_06550 [Chloroflexota bacterium]|nr:hypothetical protein [Chloroflexota bacterium]